MSDTENSEERVYGKSLKQCRAEEDAPEAVLKVSRES